MGSPTSPSSLDLIYSGRGLGKEEEEIFIERAADTRRGSDGCDRIGVWTDGAGGARRRQLVRWVPEGSLTCGVAHLAGTVGRGRGGLDSPRQLPGREEEQRCCWLLWVMTGGPRMDGRLDPVYTGVDGPLVLLIVIGEVISVMIYGLLLFVLLGGLRKNIFFIV